MTAASTPVVIAAHSLGCFATVWWATLLGSTARDKVRGAWPEGQELLDRLIEETAVRLPGARAVGTASRADL